VHLPPVGWKGARGISQCWGNPTGLGASHSDGLLLPQCSKDAQQGSSDEALSTAGCTARAEEKEESIPEELPPSPTL